jgi:hypothetical protein
MDELHHLLSKTSKMFHEEEDGLVKKLPLLLPFVLAASLVQANAQPSHSPATDTAKQVLATEKARTTALEHSDVGALERIMDDNVTYIHASGKVDTKKSYLDAIRSGQLQYISWRPMDLRVRLLGNSAVISGEYAVKVKDIRVQPNPFDINIFILTVYERRNGQWQQIAWQSTRDTGLH